MIRGNVPPSFDNRQTRQTKAASSPDKITVDFHADTERIPKRVSIVTDSNRKDFLVQEKYKKQREDDIRFKREVEAMRAAKRLQSIQNSYRDRGIVI
jgi:hypothetical protein